MNFLIEHRADLLIGVLGSLGAAAIIAAIPLTRRLPAIRIPAWAAAGFIAFCLVWYFLQKASESASIPIVDQSFESERVILDGKKFIRCHFERCTLIFNGSRAFGMDHCTFSGIKIVFGDRAGLTAFQIRQLNTDPEFRRIISEMLDSKKETQ